MNQPLDPNKLLRDGDEPLDLDAPLLSPAPFVPADPCYEAAYVCGAGSGKTSHSGETFARAFLRVGWGGLVNCVKADERELWGRYLREADRSDCLIEQASVPSIEAVLQALEGEIK